MAHYPAEFMAAVLSRNLTDLKEITLFLDECKRLQIPVLGPDVNESVSTFVTNKKGEIRFGMAGIKNVGEAAVQSIIEERKRNGPFTTIFDLTRRISSHTVNKRCLESLAKAGAFDCFEGTHRAQYFFQENTEDPIFLEKIIRHATDYHIRKDSKQQSLFGEEEEVQLKELALPECRPWSKLEQLKFEKEIAGFYMSGHPLDYYTLEFEYFCNVTIDDLKQNLKAYKGKEVSFAGIVIEKTHKVGKNGKPYGSFVVEDYYNFITLSVFSEEFLKWRHLLDEGQYIFIRARIEPRFDNPDQLVVRINNILLLPEVSEKYSKTLQLNLKLGSVTGEKVEKLFQIAKREKGRTLLRVRVFDEEENIFIELPSKKYRVKAKEMIQELSDWPDVQARIFTD
jgi:DNA polymerase-3 subunit alpha